MNKTISSAVGCSSITVGKQVGVDRYVHVSAIPFLPADLRTVIDQAAAIATLTPEEHFNVVKLHKLGQDLSLLAYSDFFEDPFPALVRSWRVSLARQTVVFRSYEESRNPPILHRKELLLAPNDPRIPAYSAVTDAAESLHLFESPHRIGFREQWYSLIAERHYTFANNKFIPLANSSAGTRNQCSDPSSEVRRHLTALGRSNFSAPVQALSRHELVHPGRSFFDYGCGRGDDVRGLSANGVDATGWDPHYAPDAPKRVADAVNIGFVINVIEDLSERVAALKDAYAHTRGVLSVAAMLWSQAPADGRAYRDGYLSSRNTFQKYFTQGQLRDFIEHTLDESAIAAGAGVFLVFRDKDLEQRFLSRRYAHKVQTAPSQGWAMDRRRKAPVRLDREKAYEENREMFENLWLRTLELGRPPEKDELDRPILSSLEEKVGSLPKALKLVFSRHDTTEYDRARALRSADLIVFLALQQFQKRSPYRSLESRLQRDIRYFFGDYAAAQTQARHVLFSIGKTEAIEQACREAADKGYGWLEEGVSLQLHVSLLGRLPTALRVYAECATVLCGPVSEFDLVKIHIRSGKVTLMKFDDFENSALPRLQQRVKVKLRDQDVDVFTYGAEHQPTLLYHKSRFMNEEFPRYDEQIAFEDSLDDLRLHDLSGYGPEEAAFFGLLEQARWRVDGFRLVRSNRIPELDEPCGAHLTYRQLIECGETQKRSGIANCPKSADTYTALYELASKVLDPVIDYFGMIRLTFGFCSAELAKQIPARIAPELDQHASHEKKKNGKPICERLGAACDFIVEDEDMYEVASWVLGNTEVDRVYLYEPDLPIHVSCSVKPARQLVQMIRNSAGKRVPRVIKQ